MTPSNKIDEPVVPVDAPALITGASRGIGRAVALSLARAGRPVALLARDIEALRAVADEARQCGAKAVTIHCDLAEASSIAGAVAEASDALGPIRVLVNNAGVFVDKPMVDTSLDELQRVLAVNLTGAILVTQAVWPQMVAAGGGVIVNIASKASIQGYHGQSAYCASKAGLLGFARAIAIEGKAHRIRVHNICPGGVDTDLIAGTPLAERLAGQVMMQPEDIAETVAFCINQPPTIDLPEVILSRFAT
jgi:NADP-dependent 3-hydroxy acid dehydrogenase YdfG